MSSIDIVISVILSFVFVFLGLYIWKNNKYQWVQTSNRPKKLINERDSTIVSKKYGLSFVLGGISFLTSLVLRIINYGMLALVVAFIGVVSALVIVFNTASLYFK